MCYFTTGGEAERGITHDMGLSLCPRVCGSHTNEQLDMVASASVFRIAFLHTLFVSVLSS